MGGHLLRVSHTATRHTWNGAFQHRVTKAEMNEAPAEYQAIGPVRNIRTRSWQAEAPRRLAKVSKPKGNVSQDKRPNKQNKKIRRRLDSDQFSSIRRHVLSSDKAQIAVITNYGTFKFKFKSNNNGKYYVRALASRSEGMVPSNHDLKRGNYRYRSFGIMYTYPNRRFVRDSNSRILDSEPISQAFAEFFNQILASRAKVARRHSRILDVQQI
jgi:hypothetical protein